MIRVHQIVIVEGKYDRHTLSNFLDASIIETGGFAIFKNKPLTDTLKKTGTSKRTNHTYRQRPGGICNPQLFMRNH